MNLFDELKRRNVYRAAAFYAAAAWLIVQVATQVFPLFHIAESVLRWIVIAAVAGFPLALVLSWFYQWTPEGFKRDRGGEPGAPVLPAAGKKLDRWITATLMLAVVLLLADKFLWRREVSAAIPGKSIAVLPFENLSRDPDNAYFAEGIQDEILTRLAKIADLKVISRTSTQKYKSAPDNLREIASQLGVATILEGSVQKSNDQVRVNVQLINASTDAHLWADIYDRKLTDLFAVESEVAKSIAEALQAKLSGSEQRALSARPTENPEAYQLYLKGRFFWNKRTAADLRKSIEYFDAAIAKDPKYALAYAGRAQSWLLLPGYGVCAPKDCFPPADMSARQALAFDDTSADAHSALGMVKMLYEFDVNASIAEFERAITLDPNSATAHHWLANHPLAAAGQAERAIKEVTRALELDPLAMIVNANLGQAYIYARRYDDAITQLRKTVELGPNFYFAHVILGSALELKGQLPEALAEFKTAVALNDEDSWPKSMLGHLYGKIGQTGDARNVLEDMLRRKERHEQVDSYGLALLYLGLGDRAQAITRLEAGFADREGFNIAPMRADPYLEELHGDPRFEALAEKVMPRRDFNWANSAAK